MRPLWFVSMRVCVPDCVPVILHSQVSVGGPRTPRARELTRKVPPVIYQKGFSVLHPRRMLTLVVAVGMVSSIGLAFTGAPAIAASPNPIPTHPVGNPALGLAPAGSPNLPLAPVGNAPVVLSPDFAYGQCVDWAAAQPTPAHAGPYSNSTTLKFFNKGDEVGGSCYWYNNTNEQRWYMEIYLGSNYAYIWVQRLVHGQDHICIVNGVDAEKIWYGNYCDLIDYP
jgi:hypothetical protein